jgi:hypothetical protein
VRKLQGAARGVRLKNQFDGFSHRWHVILLNGSAVCGTQLLDQAVERPPLCLLVPQRLDFCIDARNFAHRFVGIDRAKQALDLIENPG